MWLVAPVSAIQSAPALAMRGEQGWVKSIALAFPANPAVSVSEDASSAWLALLLPFDDTGAGGSKKSL